MKKLLITLARKFRIQVRSTWIGNLYLIQRVLATSREYQERKNSTLEIDGQCILIPDFRQDGVGIQAMVRICVMFLARQTHATYVHIPFITLMHQNIDPTGHSLTQEQWAAKWEAFFNFGRNEFSIADLVNVTGKVALARKMSAKNWQFDDPMDARRDMLPKLVERIRSRDSGVYTFNLGLCRQPQECQLFLDAEFIKTLQEKFKTNGYKPAEMLYKEQFLNIAVHIRRGDVWDACQAGTKEWRYTNKFVSEEYYVEVLQRLHNFFRGSPKPVCFHIFSDGQPSNFVKFTFMSNKEAFLKLETGTVIENIQFHFRQNSIDTLYHMIKAPIFVPGKSTFSVVAVLLNNSYVFYEDQIWEFYQYDLLEKYIEGNPQFISLAQLKAKAANVMAALIKSGLMN